MSCALCFIHAIRKEASGPNSCSVWADQRPDIQTKQKQEPCLSFLTAGPRLKNRGSLTGSSWKLTCLDKWTPEHHECNNCLHPLPLLPPLDEEERRRYHPPTKRNLESKKFLRRITYFPQSSTLFIDEKEAQVFTVQNFNPQKDKSHLISSLRVSRWIGSELSHLIRRTNLERHASSKSDGYLIDAATNETHI